MTRILFVNGHPEEYVKVKDAVHALPEDVSVSYIASGDNLFNLLQYYTPDMLFIDICYEHQHGVDCFHKLRSNRKFDSLPIFVYCPESQWLLIKDGDSSPLNFHLPKYTASEKVRLSVQQELRRFWQRVPHTIENVFADQVVKL